MKKSLVLLHAFASLLMCRSVFAYQDCVSRRYGEDKIVCVCNSTYCDTISSLEDTIIGKFQLFTTSPKQLGLKRSSLTFATSEENAVDATITIDRSRRFQSIIGFGGAFSDSFGINVNSLPPGAQDKLLETYFSKDGSEYRLCRVPVGGTDFSTRFYSYADSPVDNYNLQNFSLAIDDYDYKIPYIHKAQNLLHKNNITMKLFASAWTAPPWMKTNNGWTGPGFLKKEYYQLWANYYIKFFTAYKQNNVSFWGMTTHNEPSSGFINVGYTSMGWYPWDMNKWIGNNLGPTIRNSQFKDLKIMLHDDSRLLLPLLQLFYFTNEKTVYYADGVAVHWYQDFITPPFFLNFATCPKKNLFKLKSEACSGSKLIDGDQILDFGSWTRGEHYITNIIEDLQHMVSGWVDWNMALDMEGGPSYVSGNDSPILVNASAGEFYKQPMYYGLAHFSKFLIPGSIRLGLDAKASIDVTAFIRPDNLTVVIIYNRQNTSMTVRLVDDAVSTTDLVLDRKSINTLVYK